MIKFLPGLVLLEIVSVAVMLAILQPQDPMSWAKVVAILAVLALIISFWFDAMAKSSVKDQFVAEKSAHLDTLSAEKLAYMESLSAEKAAFQETLAAEKEAFSREREKIRVKAEVEKQTMLKDAHQQVQKETRSVQQRASLKVGAAFTALGAGGVVLLLTELVTLGMITLMTAGGALGGYVMRGKQQTKLPAQPKDVIELNARKSTHPTKH